MAWFDIIFPWIGLAGALGLLALLPTDVFRSDRRLPRRSDLTWLSWAGVLVYLLHNVEEYGVDWHGQSYAFPKAFCAMFGFSRPGAVCPVPGAVFAAVNVSLFWVAAPLAAAMSRRHRLAGIAIHGVIAVNLAAHVGQGIASGAGYNPGWLTAVVLFLPLSVWTLLLSGVAGRAAAAFALGLGLAIHGVLIASMLLLVKGLVHSVPLIVLVQVLNAALLIVVPRVAERWTVLAGARLEPAMPD